MRALIVVHGYPPFGVTGVERLAQQTAQGLVAAGHEVRVLARRPSGAPPSLQMQPTRLDGVDVTFVAGAGATLHEFPGQTPLLEQIFERVLIEACPDVVLFSHTLYQSPADILVARRWGIPAVVELHDFFFACPLVHLQRPSGELCAGPDGGRECARTCFEGQPDAERRWTERAGVFREALDAATTIVVPSRYVADWFGGYASGLEHVEVLPNGVPLDASPRPRVAGEGGLRLATLGAVVPHKGAHHVIEALGAAGVQNARYTLLGPTNPSYATELRELAAAVPGLQLRFDGPYHPSDLPAILACVDAVVIPSEVAETFSIVAREALACGVPVVAADAGALPEAVRHGDNGLLFDLADPMSLVVVLRRLADEPELLERLRRGIGADDWISAAERTRRLIALLEGARDSLQAGHGATPSAASQGA